jgi:4-amino-4-deoxy-L-arabinose transferase-like glycosyltransferase
LQTRVVLARAGTYNPLTLGSSSTTTSSAPGIAPPQPAAGESRGSARAAATGSLFPLIAIILLGLSIRLLGLFWAQGYCHIGPSDALEAYSVAVDYACGEAKAGYLGQPNFNARAKLPGPLWTWFCFRGLRTNGSIQGAILGLILLNTATIYLTYLLAWRTLGRAGAIWSALLAATLPFPIYYSVSLYNPNVMPFLGSLLFLALWNVIQHERSRAIFWVVLILMAMPQFHMCVIMLIPAVIVVLVLGARRLNFPWLSAGLLAGALLYIPYLSGEITHSWTNTRGMLSGTGHFGWGGLKALTAPLSLLTNWTPQWTGSAKAYLQLGRACFGWPGLLFALNLLSLLFALCVWFRLGHRLRTSLRGFWRAPRQVFHRSRGPLFLLILIAVSLLFAVLTGKNFRTHYSIVLFAPLLALAGRATAVWLRSRRWFAIALLLLTCGNIWFMTAMFHDLNVRIAGGEVFIASFQNLETVYRQLRAHAGADGPVKVDDRDFWVESQHHSEAFDSLLISRYVAIREKQSGRLAADSAPAIYRLAQAQPALRQEPAVAYQAHGIVLLRTRP